MWVWILGLFILGLKIAFVLVSVLVLAAYLVLLERVLLGRFQIRYGPNRVGPHGLFQPIADGIKLMLKEDFIPNRADRIIYLFAPAVVAITALLMFAVVPFGPDLMIGGHKIPMV